MTLAAVVRRIVAILAALVATGAIARGDEVNDYPTAARAEYVFGCLKANGETRQATHDVLPTEQQITPGHARNQAAACAFTSKRGITFSPIRSIERRTCSCVVFPACRTKII